jgi:hypothetical protein
VGLAVVVGVDVSAGAGRADDGWGTITGQVVFGGDAIPERKPVDVTKDQEHCLSKGPILSEDWVINGKNKGVKWAFVWLAPADPKTKKKIPIHPALQKVKLDDEVIDQPCCKFEPHAVAIREGQTIIAKNSAPIAHNTNWTGGIRNPGNNILIPAGQQIPIKDLKADKYPVKLQCNIHPWMSGWVRIFDHPYFAVTDADGKFVIKNAPAGEFRLVVWQEAIGYKDGAAGRDGMPITIQAGKTTDLGKLELKESKP